MSVAEFGPRSQTTFMSALPQMRLEPRAGRHEASWHSLQSALDLKSARLKLLLDITNSMVAHVEVNDLLREVTIGARRLMQSDFAILALLDSQSGLLRINASEFADDTVLDAEAVNSFVETLAAHVFSTGKPWTGISAGLIVGLDLNDDLKWAAVGFKSGCCILPLVIRDRVLGILALGKRERIAYTQDEIDFLTQVSGQMAIAVENSLVHGELRKLKDSFNEERVCVEDEIGGDRLSPRNVSQHCVQLLWSQYDESEHNHKQDFSAKTHDSPLGHALAVGSGGCCVGQPLFVSFHS
jgi:transcriptional regulator with GAF, ATPase, and Fis domain